MRSTAFIRTAGVAFALYGVLGIAIAGFMLLVGMATFSELERLRTSFERDRTTLVQSLRTVGRTVGAAGESTGSFEGSLASAQESANTASQLAFDTSHTFRSLAQQMQLQVFGIQPLVTLAPQFEQGSEQLLQLAITLGDTRDAMATNRSEITRMTNELDRLRGEVALVADAFDRSTQALSAPGQLLPFQVAFYGMSGLVFIQSLFSLVAGFALLRYHTRIRVERQGERTLRLAA